MRRFFALVLSMLLASVGILVGASPASAHHNTVRGTAVCEADGTYTVTWTFANSENRAEYAWVSSATPAGSTIAKDAGSGAWEVTQTPWTSENAPTDAQANVPARGTVTFTQKGVPGSATKADVTIKGVWTNNSKRTVGPNDNTTYYTGVTLPAGGCGQDITVKAASLCEHEVDNTEWHFVITQTTESQAPASIQVTWVGGVSATVQLEKVTGGTAHYRTTANLDKDLQTATARIIGAWTGQFNVSHGPACGSEVNNPKYTVDQRCGYIAFAFTNKDIPAGPTDTKVRATFTVTVDGGSPETVTVPVEGTVNWSTSFSEDSGRHRVVVTPQGGSATTYTVDSDCSVPAAPTAKIDSECVATGGAKGVVTLTNGATPAPGQDSAPVTFTVKVEGQQDQRVEVSAGKSTTVTFEFLESPDTKSVSVSAEGMTTVSKDVSTDCSVPAQPSATIEGTCLVQQGGGAQVSAVLANTTVPAEGQFGVDATFTIEVDGTPQAIDGATSWTIAPGKKKDLSFTLPEDSGNRTVVVKAGGVTVAQQVVSTDCQGIVVDASGICRADTPFYDISVTTRGLPAVDPKTGKPYAVTVQWLQANEDGSLLIKDGKPVPAFDPATEQPYVDVFELGANGTLKTGELLWKGAKVVDGVPTDWPGWDLRTDGTWFEVPDGGVRPAAILRVSVNPTVDTVALYPPATPGCNANPPTNVGGVEDEVDSPEDEQSQAVVAGTEDELAKTGGDLGPVLALSVMALVGGAALIAAGRIARR